jgi:uncharacterized membrane protein
MARKALTWLILLIVVVLLMALASLMTGPEGVRLQGFGWLLWVAIGAVLVYIVYFATADHPAWQIGTREVVYMAIGAALYGVFSYLFNGTVFVVPSVSQVALRPAIVFPVFFGYVFGPAVGFFTGAVGNILGDFLTGWGVFPAWDIGNGLIGLVAGLPVILGRERALNILTGLVAVVGVALSLWAMTTEIESPFFGGPLSPLMRWVPLIGAALVVALRFALGRNIALASVIVWSGGQHRGHRLRGHRRHLDQWLSARGGPARGVRAGGGTEHPPRGHPHPVAGGHLQRPAAATGPGRRGGMSQGPRVWRRRARCW